MYPHSRIIRLRTRGFIHILYHNSGLKPALCRTDADEAGKRLRCTEQHCFALPSGFRSFICSFKKTVQCKVSLHSVRRFTAQHSGVIIKQGDNLRSESAYQEYRSRYPQSFMPGVRRAESISSIKDILHMEKRILAPHARASRVRIHKTAPSRIFRHELFVMKRQHISHMQEAERLQKDTAHALDSTVLSLGFRLTTFAVSFITDSHRTFPDCFLIARNLHLS